MTTEIRYSDGASVESKILSLLNEAKELGSAEQIALEAYGEWPVRYHLCPERANLVRHLDFSGLDVLELGAGMGAVSRYIAETARSLTVIEGTESRFRALSARLRDLKNWSGKVANIQDTELPGKFDVVCVFGVLEYAELYVTPPEGQSAFSAFLAKAASHLKEGGALILAIENQLGLKYWSGAAEDHTGAIYDGIAGYPVGKSPRTFSRKQLRALLTEVNLPEIEEFFPFPDYKIPSSVLSLAMIESAPALSADLAANQPFQNYGRPRFRAFPDALGLQSVAQAGLLPELSNSFLFVASRKESRVCSSLFSKARKNGEVGWHYSSSRRMPVRTVFSLKDGRVLVTKEGIEKIAEAGDLRVKWMRQEAAPVSSGEKLRTRLLRYAYFGEWAAFESELTRFLADTISRHSDSTGELDGRALDAVFTNAALGAGGYDLFDIEWILLSPMSVSWFIFRNVFLFVSDLDFFSSQAPFSCLRELYERCCSKLQISPEFAADLEKEARLQVMLVHLKSHESAVEALRSLFQTPFGASPFIRSPRAFQLLGHRKLAQLADTLKRIPGVTRFAKKVLR